MIDTVLTIALGLLALSLLGALARVVIGPGTRDRLLGVALTSTTGIGFLVLASVRFDVPALRDAALVIGVLAVVIVAVRVHAERRVADG